MEQNSNYSTSAVSVERWNLMFRELKQAVSLPSENHPAAKVWKQSDLAGIITKIRKAHIDFLKSTFPPAKEIIARTLEMGWIQPIPVENPTAKVQVAYLVDMEATANDLPDPLEFLQGYEPLGVICHFGALEFHELTTQEAAFYHIALLGKPISKSGQVIIPRNSPSTISDKKPPNPLGTHLFDYQGIPCYTTQRDPSLVPGIQHRIIGSRTRLKITTFEQTMLDALIHPRRCGGESVVFEAWERGTQRWDASRMDKHLDAIGREDLERRVGAMLSVISRDIPAPLRNRLNFRKDACMAMSADQTISLLHGFSYSNTLSEWLVDVP